MLARKDRPWWDPSNPFWRYAGLQGLCLGAAFLLGGWGGVGAFRAAGLRRHLANWS